MSLTSKRVYYPAQKISRYIFPEASANEMFTLPSPGKIRIRYFVYFLISLTGAI